MTKDIDWNTLANDVKYATEVIRRVNELDERLAKAEDEIRQVRDILAKL